MSDVVVHSKGDADEARCRGMIITYFVNLMANVLAEIGWGGRDGLREVLSQLMVQDTLDAESWRGEGNVSS